MMSQKKLISLLTVLFITIASISFMFSPFFNIRRIQINGLNHIEKSEMENTVSAYYGNNLWLLRNTVVENMIAQNKYVKDVVINKKLPERLRIKIEERIPVGQIKNNERYIIFSKKGIILEKNNEKDNQIPKIINLGYKFENDHRLTFSPELAKIVQALSGISEKTRKKLENIIYEDNKLDILSNGGIVVETGDFIEIEKKFQLLEYTLEKIEKNNLEPEYIDLSVPGRPAIQIE